MRDSRIWVVALFALAITAPVVQMVGHFVQEPALVGYTSKTELLPLEWCNWSSGKYQARLNGWVTENIGFRVTGIRTDNQLNFSLFSESSIKTADVPIVGKDGYLYARAYVDTYNRRRNSQLESPEKFARALRRLQDGLQKRGKAFVFVISPSKAEIYPEFLPSRFLSPSTRGRQSDYQRLLPALRKEGVHLVDGHALFMEQKEREPWLLFAPGGIHWQEYGAWQVLDRVVRELESQMGRPLATVACEGVADDNAPWSKPDADLAYVMNIWAIPHWDQTRPRPRLRSGGGPSAHRPSLLLVGDSFMAGLLVQMHRHRMYSLVDFFYYYGTHSQYPSRKMKRLVRQKVKWEEDVFSKDAVILEINEIMLDARGWGFVSDALEHLEDTPNKH